MVYMDYIKFDDALLMDEDDMAEVDGSVDDAETEGEEDEEDEEDTI